MVNYLVQATVLIIILLIFLLYLLSQKREYGVLFIFLGLLYNQFLPVTNLKIISLIILLFYLFIEIEKINPKKVDLKGIGFFLIKEVSIIGVLFYFIQSVTLNIASTLIVLFALVAPQTSIHKIISKHFFQKVKEKEILEAISYENAISIIWTITIILLTLKFSQSSVANLDWLKNLLTIAIASMSIGLIIGYLYDKTIFHIQKFHKHKAEKYGLISLIVSFTILFATTYLIQGSYVLAVAFFAIVAWQIKSQKKVVSYISSNIELFIDAFTFFIFGTILTTLTPIAIVTAALVYLILVAINFIASYVLFGNEKLFSITFSEYYGSIYLAIIVFCYSVNYLNTNIVSFSLMLMIYSYLGNLLVNSKFYFPKKKKY